LGTTEVGLPRTYVLIILVVDICEQAQVHTPLDTRIFVGYGPISAGDTEALRFCIAGTTKHAVGTLLSKRELVGLSISNRPAPEKIKSQQGQGESSHSDSRS
jgi:hypothetical protein